VVQTSDSEINIITGVE